MILAIDPGPAESAFVLYDEHNRKVSDFWKEDNGLVLRRVEKLERNGYATSLVIEMIASYGMPVGREVFETCVWIGRFVQAWRRRHSNGYENSHDFMYRSQVKNHLCGSMRAKDSNVRQALIDAFGGSKAIGTKKQPGPLYGIKGDMWQALGVAVTYADQLAQQEAA